MEFGTRVELTESHANGAMAIEGDKGTIIPPNGLAQMLGLEYLVQFDHLEDPQAVKEKFLKTI